MDSGCPRNIVYEASDGAVNQYGHEGLNLTNLIVLLHDALDFLLLFRHYQNTYGCETSHFLDLSPLFGCARSDR